MSLQNSFKLLLLLFAFPAAMRAQQPADTAKLKIEFAEVVENFERGPRTVRQLSGNVRLRQERTLVFSDFAVLTGNDAVLRGKVAMEQGDSLRVFADSALYNADTEVADLFGDVVLVNDGQQIFTNRLQYNLQTKVATYHSGATLSNGKSQLRSRHGYYYTQDKVVYFRGDVEVTDPEFTLRTDTLAFHTESRVARFLAPTLISQRGSRIYTEGGFYNMDGNYAEFDKNPQYERGSQRGRARKMYYNGATNEYTLEGEAFIDEPDRARQVEADVIRYNTDTDIAILTGNAHYRDSTQDITGQQIRYDNRNKRYQLIGRGRVVDPPNIIEADSLDFNDLLGSGLALGNVIYQDTASDYTILAHRMDYNKTSQYISAFGSSTGPSGRPLMKTLIENDTLYLSADTLTSYQTDTATDARLLIAYPDVRILKSDLQGSCDSLTYNSADSLFWFYRLKNLPIVWSDTSQFSGDTIVMRLRDRKLDRIWLRQNALIVNSPDERFFNQIQGRDCTAFFRDDQVREMHVEGNAEAIYYGLDDRRAYLGVNQTQCSEMRLFFNNNQVEGIRFYTEPQGTFTPMKEAGGATKRLKNFFWEKQRRPRTIDDLLAQKLGI
jgi:lipopolysaccharide export system protein LptA